MAGGGPPNLSSTTLEIVEGYLVALLRIWCWYKLNRQEFHGFCEWVLGLKILLIERQSIAVACQS